MLFISDKIGAWRNFVSSLSIGLRRHRLPWLAIFCCCCVSAVDQPTIISLSFLSIAVLGLMALPIRFIIFSLGIGSLCAFLHGHSEKNLARQRSIVEPTVWTEFEAWIGSRTSTPHGSWKCEASVVSANQQPSIDKIVLYGRGMPPQLGETIATTGRWEPIPPPRNEGEFDRRTHLARHGIVTQCAVRSWTSVKQPHFGWRFTSRARLAFKKAITLGLNPESDEAKVILAMVMGQQPMDDNEVVESFRQTGTLHLFSVSGQHVNLVAIILWFALRGLRLSRRHAVLLLIPAIFSYAWITGASAPAMRAAWMASLFLAAFFFQRKSHLLQALSIVVIAALLIDGKMLFLPGVQLSYGIVAVISIGLSCAHHLIDRFPWNDPYLPRDLYTPWQTRMDHSWSKLLQSIFISISAFFGSSFLTAAYFSMITPIAIIANLVLTPLVAALLSLSILSTFLSPISTQASIACNRMNQGIARACMITTQQFAHIPGSHLIASPHRPPRDTLRIFDLPRGGGAISIQARDSDLLLDCGNKRSFRSSVLPSLRHFGQDPTALILSNTQAGHIGGAVDLLKQFSLHHIITPIPTARTPSFRTLSHTARELAVSFTTADLEKPLFVSSGIELIPLSLPDATENHARADDQTAIYLLHFHGFRFLLLQDASATRLQELVESRKNLSCDVVVMGRHRLHSPTLRDTILAFRPRAVVATHSDFPESESIPSDWPKIAQKNRVSLFHQGQTGMVSAMWNDDGSMTLRAFLTPQQCRLSSAKFSNSSKDSSHRTR